MILRNAEGHLAFDIRADWHKNRAPGLSAMVRLRDEETWCRLAIESIVGWCDEVVVALNCCADGTPKIIEALRRRYADKIRVYAYPFQLHPMGPGHDACAPGSVHACAYFYNWVQAQTMRAHVVKWDGDMVAMDWLGEQVRDLMASGLSRIKFRGADLVGDLRSIGCHPSCPTNGVYLVTAATFYVQGPVTQNLQGLPPVQHEIADPAFVHLKWCGKAEAAATVQWPENWREIEHFRRIYQRRVPVAPYGGEYPASVAGLL